MAFKPNLFMDFYSKKNARNHAGRKIYRIKGIEFSEEGYYVAM